MTDDLRKPVALSPHKVRDGSRVSTAFGEYRDEVLSVGTSGYSLLLNARIYGPEHFETTYPDGWQATYEKEMWVLRDPIFHWALMNKGGGDARWSDIPRLAPGSRGLMRKAKKLGLVYGAIFVRKGYGGFVSFLSVARPDRELTMEEMARVSDLATEFFAEIDIEERLTPKATEVLQLLADHKTIPEIAEELNLSESAIKTRLNDARKNTGVPSTSALVIYARRRGLLQ